MAARTWRARSRMGSRSPPRSPARVSRSSPVRATSRSRRSRTSGTGSSTTSCGASRLEAPPSLRDMEKVLKTEQEWREQLAPDQYAVLRQAATEPPFTGKFVDTKDDGVYT